MESVGDDIDEHIGSPLAPSPRSNEQVPFLCSNSCLSAAGFWDFATIFWGILVARGYFLVFSSLGYFCLGYWCFGKGLLWFKVESCWFFNWVYEFSSTFFE